MAEFSTYISRDGETVADLRKPIGIPAVDVAVSGIVEQAAAAMPYQCAEHFRNLTRALEGAGITVDRVILPLTFGTNPGQTAFKASRIAEVPYKIGTLSKGTRPVPYGMMPPSTPKVEVEQPKPTSNLTSEERARRQAVLRAAGMRA